MLDQKILIELQEYVQSFLGEFTVYNCQESIGIESTFCEDIDQTELEDFINSNRKQTFQQLLFSYINQTGLSDPEVYKRAGIDRKHFSKIRTNSNYRPKKNTIIALSLALELNRNETNELLSSASYSLSDSDTYDLVVQFCLEKRIYNIDDVNQALDYFRLEPLVGTL